MLNIKNFWHNFKWGIKNLRRYFKIVWRTRDFDFQYILDMMKVQLGYLLISIETGYEVEEDKNKKVKDIKRAIELLTNIEEDNFLDRSGYIKEATKYIFTKSEKHPDCTEMKIKNNPEYPNYNGQKVREASDKLEDSEWDELFKILKQNLKSWWD